MTKKEKIGLALFMWGSFAAFTAETPGTFWHYFACGLAIIGFLIFYVGG